MKFLHLIADYGTGDPAFSEVIHSLKRLEPEMEVKALSVSPLSTLSTGFWLAQLGAYNNYFEGLAIYANTAPREDKLDPREDNEGEKFLFAELANGTPIMAVNSGFCFSFVRPYIKRLQKVKVPNKGSQFRSRDFYPEAVVGIMNEEEKYLGDVVELGGIPDPPRNKIVWIDGYGNIKTSIRTSAIDLNPKDRLEIIINNKKGQAVFDEGIFAVKNKELVFAPGSSGGKDAFMEISLRGSSAASFFNNPAVEQNIELNI